MVISIISIATAAILDAILNAAKCSRVPGRHHSDSDYVAQDDLETIEKHLTYQSARFVIECITGHPDYTAWRRFLNSAGSNALAGLVLLCVKWTGHSWSNT